MKEFVVSCYYVVITAVMIFGSLQGTKQVK